MNQSYSKGISWISDCRIPFEDETILLKGYKGDMWATIKKDRVEDKINTQGRFPANLLVSDDMLNDGSESKSQCGNSTNIGATIFKIPTDESKRGKKSGFGDKGTNSRYYSLDKWFEKLLNED